MKINFRVICALLLTFVCLHSKAQSPDYKFIKKIPLEGDGKWDYMKMDGERERLFVSHGDQVHVIDLNTDKQIGVVKNLKGVHGIALAKAEGKGYITNGTDNTVTIFDYNTFGVIKTLAISGKKPDAIIYDSFSKSIIAFCGASDNAVVISVPKNEEIGTIALGGAPEFAVSDGKGMIYNNLEDKSEVLAIDIAKMKVVKRFPLGKNTAPTGITMDNVTNRLFITCNDSHTLAVLDANNGKIVASLPIGNKVDAVIFDKDSKLIATSNGEGNISLIKLINADTYKVVQTVQTHPGCKTMVHRGTTHNLFLSSAEMEGKIVKPGTFGIYVYGPGK